MHVLLQMEWIVGVGRRIDVLLDGQVISRILALSFVAMSIIKT
jgi:hypothetical protein